MHAVYTWAMFMNEDRIEHEGKKMLNEIEDDINRILEILLKD
jgi:hypothetical protein